jgi:ssDNA-binding Zn-finger/Zn-ribbon topoisomerase 1
MDYRTTIMELEYELNNTISEDTLYKIISEKLKKVENSQSHIYESLDEKDKKALKTLSSYLEHLDAFINLKEELNDIADLQHFMELRGGLKKLAEIFSGYPVSKRIQKELRELNEKFPAIRNKAQQIQDSKLNLKIAKLEKNGPKCPRKHNMVVRQGEPDEYFWGCSHFPDCFFTRKLSNKEWDYLFSDKILINGSKKRKDEKQNYISTTLVAFNHGCKQHELFSLFAKIKWIEKINKKWRLTEIGKKSGGIYKTTEEGISYIAWPETILERANLVGKLINKKRKKLKSYNTSENININLDKNPEIKPDDIINEFKPSNIKFPKSEMPQAKLIKFGIDTLNNAELLALIIRTGTQSENVFDICNKILKSYTLMELSEISLEALKRISGIGEVQACRLLAMFELFKRLKVETKGQTNNEINTEIQLNNHKKVEVQSNKHDVDISSDKINYSVDIDSDKSYLFKVDEYIKSLPIEFKMNDEDLLKIREKYSRAYEAWTSQEDHMLKILYKKKISISKLAKVFQRKPGAIRSRIKKIIEID